jgi:hypothetical protein
MTTYKNYIVYNYDTSDFEEDNPHEQQVPITNGIVRIFNNKEKVDKFMMSLEWKAVIIYPFRSKNKHAMRLPYEAYEFEYNEDGEILNSKKLDYMEFAPPLPDNL